MTPPGKRKPAPTRSGRACPPMRPIPTTAARDCSSNSPWRIPAASRHPGRRPSPICAPATRNGTSASAPRTSSTTTRTRSTTPTWTPVFQRPRSRISRVLPQNFSAHYCALSPPRERAVRRFNNNEWVRGIGSPPHPTVGVEYLSCPLPRRGEGALTIAALGYAAALKSPAFLLSASDSRKDADCPRRRSLLAWLAERGRNAAAPTTAHKTHPRPLPRRERRAPCRHRP